jgi:Icc-related predicted phosphoesterase
LPYYYLDYIISSLNVPLYFVRGNHASDVEYTESGPRVAPQGGIDLHRRCLNHRGLLLAGVEGSIRYNQGKFQYSQAEMWGHVFSLVPRFLLNRLVYGRFLDIFVSHAPPWQINDQDDHVHQGIKAFRWILQVFRPTYHFHGHVHLYRPDVTQSTAFENTHVINTYGYREHVIDPKSSA